MMRGILGREPKEPLERRSEEHGVGRLALSEPRIKRILVAVDFSEASRRALEYGAALARTLGAEMVLLHVFEGVPGELKILEASFVDTSFLDEAKVDLAQWERGVASVGVTVKAVFRDARAIDREILAAAKECSADLIVVGRHGSESFFLKNTVRKVLEHAPCPVLVGP